MAEIPPPTVRPSFGFEYVAEGGANILFRIKPPVTKELERGSGDDSFGPSTPPPSELETWQTDIPDLRWPFSEGEVLLRLRKDVPGATPVEEALRDYEKIMVPLFGRQHLAEQWPVILGVGTVAALNSQLTALEESGRRPSQRRGVFLKDDALGSVVRDMSTRPGRDLCTVEIKPKWLVQSPTAPRGARRCRTCALRALRASKANKSPSHAGLCPLRLLSENEIQYETAIMSILTASGFTTDYPLKERLQRFLRQSKMMALLHDLQITYSTDKMLSSKVADMDLRVAMTIRDCAVFIRVCEHAAKLLLQGMAIDMAQVPVDANGEVEARVADLDLKSPEKLPQWQSIERDLVEGSWYIGYGTSSSVEGGLSCILAE